MRKLLPFLGVFIALLLAPSLVRYLQFYSLGSADRPPVPVYEPDVPPVPTPAAAAFTDEPEAGEGLVLLDQAHGNDFTLNEIGYLDGRLAARGYELLPFTGGDLATTLRVVDAYIVIAPLASFSADEVTAVADFVDQGGRLLLIGDPTRFELVFDEEDIFAPPVVESDELPLNTLANEFDLIFNGDYLYNTRENEGNFRNIILPAESFTAEEPVTDGLEQVVFYGAHSLQVGPEAEALITADDNTWSSATDRPGGLVMAATGGNGRVLALGDINFITEPYFTVFDNSQFIAQIADFLTQPAERVFDLADFPYLYSDAVDLVYLGNPALGPDAFDEIIALQDSLRQVGQTLTLARELDGERDALVLGLYNQAETVADVLEAAEISLAIDPPVDPEDETDDTAVDEEEAETDANDEEEDEEPEQIRLVESTLGSVQMSGTALILLDETEDRRHVIVLAASKDGLENTVSRLLDLIPFDADYALADCLQQGNLALCPTDVADEPVEAELITGGESDTPTDEEEPAPDDGNGEDGDDDNGDSDSDLDLLDTTDQGGITLGETVESAVAEGEIHAWTFADGPAVIDITVVGAEDMDAVLELYDPDGNYVAGADSSFEGGEEILLGVEVEAGDYTITVRDFFDDGGDYTLTVEGESTANGDLPGDEGDEGEEDEAVPAITGLDVLIYADNEGEALTTGYTDVELFADLLSNDNSVTTWVWSEDGGITADALAEVDLLIWDSGDYRDEEGLFSDDATFILEFLEAGGEVFVVGASPSLLGGVELGALSDIEISGDNAILLSGLEVGEIITLPEPIETVISDSAVDDLAAGEFSFLLRGPDSEEPGDLVGVAIYDSFTDQRSVFLLMPYRLLPSELGETLLANVLAWLYQDADISSAANVPVAVSSSGFHNS